VCLGRRHESRDRGDDVTGRGSDTRGRVKLHGKKSSTAETFFLKGKQCAFLHNVSPRGGKIFLANKGVGP